MKEFFNSMFSEGGKISHKRVISITASVMILFMAAFATLNYKEFVVHIFDWLIVFVLVMSGVATLPQILSLIRGTPPPKDENRETFEAGGSLPGDPDKPNRPPGS
jgi:hypothetical protein